MIFIEWYIIPAILIMATLKFIYNSNWLKKIILFLGGVVGFTVFFAFAFDIILHEHAWYWKLPFIVILVVLFLGTIINSHKAYIKWKNSKQGN